MYMFSFSVLIASPSMKVITPCYASFCTPSDQPVEQMIKNMQLS